MVAHRRKKALESNRPTQILLAYAVFLLVCGATGFAQSGFRPQARSALVVSASTAALMALCAYLSRVSASTRSRKIGIHLGLLLPLLLAGVFAWRAHLAWTSPDKAYVANLLASMAAGSLVTLVALLVHKPPPPPKKKTAD
jgi:hypothetical protein